MFQPIPRRTMLKGLGVSIGLPFLEAMLPRNGSSIAHAGTVLPAPKRLAVVYTPNGVHRPYWVPTETGTDYDFSRTLKPMEPFRKDILVLSGMSLDKAKPNGDGNGDHARAMASFLTGVQVHKTEGTNIRGAISADQLIAKQVGRATRFPSLELGLDYGKLEGACDPGYACTYSNNLSWRGDATPAIKEVNPRIVFDRMFAGRKATDAASESQEQSELYNRSILDFTRESISQLNGKLGASDRRKMDEYVDSIREIERRLDRSPLEVSPEITKGLKRPLRVPENFSEHFRLMADLLVLSFQMDLTRVCTFALGVEQSRRTYREIGISEEHHGLTHHAHDPEKIEKVAQIDHYIVEQFAYLVQKMKSIPEGDGTLLDNSMLLFGNGNGDGAHHDHDDLPILLAGRGGGTIDPGRHVRLDEGTPFMNLVLSLMDRMGVKMDRFGDSTGRVTELTV
jgi:hypothetical protein